MATDQGKDRSRFEALLEQAFNAGYLVDAVITKSQRETDELWEIRDNLSCCSDWFPVFIYDVSLAMPDMEDYLETVQVAFGKQWPRGKLAIFGHLRDGNLLLITGSGSKQDHHQANEIIYSALAPLGGSLSAEHGIGLEKRDYLY